MPRINTAQDYAAHFIKLYSEYTPGKMTTPADLAELHNIMYTSGHLANKYVQNYRTAEEKAQIRDNVPKEAKSFNDAITNFSQKCADAGKLVAEGKLKGKELEDTIHECAKYATRITKGLDALKDPKDVENAKGFRKFWKEDVKLDKGRAVMHLASEKTQNAAKWIEETRKRYGKGEILKTETIARIFAARMLANAQRGKRRNIDKTQLSQFELDNLAAKVNGSGAFKDFMSKTKIDDKVLKDGHGGMLEEQFEKFLVDNRNKYKDGVGFDIGNRYQSKIDAALKLDAEKAAAAENISKGWEVVDGNAVREEMNPKPKAPEKPNYETMRQFFRENKDLPNLPENEKIRLAAKMAAASEFTNKKLDMPYDENKLDKRADEIMKDPGFKFATRDPKNVDLLLQGKPGDFALNLDALSRTADAMLGVNDSLYTVGYPQQSLSRLENAAKNDPDLQKVVDSVHNLQKPGNDPKKVMETLNTIMEYQDKNAGELGATANKVNDTMVLLNEMTSGTAFQRTLIGPQIEKINQARNLSPDHQNYLTVNKVEREGRLARENERLDKFLAGKDVDIQFKNDGQKELREAKEKMENGVNYGHSGKHAPKEVKTDIDKLLENLDKPQMGGPVAM